MNLLKGNKFILITLLSTIIIIIGGSLLFSRGSKDTSGDVQNIPTDSYIYFYGNGCPHCENVEKFMETWDKKESIKLTKMEVWYNNQNAKVIADKAGKCGISKNDLAVPMLVTLEGECISGDTPIIDFLKTL